MAASSSSGRFFLVLLLLSSPLGAKGETCGFFKSCPYFCCGNCIFKYCCSDVLKKFDDNDILCSDRSIEWEEKDEKMGFESDLDHNPPPGFLGHYSFPDSTHLSTLPTYWTAPSVYSAGSCSTSLSLTFRDIRGHWSNYLCAHCGHHHLLFNVFLLLFVQDVPKAQTCGDHHQHDHRGPLCIPPAARRAAWLPWGHVPGLPTYACPARDASCTLSSPVPATLPCPANRTSCLPRGSAWCWSAVPYQSASIQPCIRGASKDWLLSCSCALPLKSPLSFLPLPACQCV
ncbi:protein shisa-5 isoform X2 [Sarcophilus harrisii]|uniref:protein shisa-5 isoform X2 n=1 Tax=Sarcophilus harrisii TaxID=9305 RepID=UPI001301BE71|nr:protein shisa-5 isoform X2 [Sarcophilus harrisii]